MGDFLEVQGRSEEKRFDQCSARTCGSAVSLHTVLRQCPGAEAADKKESIRRLLCPVLAESVLRLREICFLCCPRGGKLSCVRFRLPQSLAVLLKLVHKRLLEPCEVRRRHTSREGGGWTSWWSPWDRTQVRGKVMSSFARQVTRLISE